jgi:hypothetical protein
MFAGRLSVTCVREICPRVSEIIQPRAFTQPIAARLETILKLRFLLLAAAPNTASVIAGPIAVQSKLC